ncbi:carbohydrate sulfotransferase 11-like [Hyalella azteca]|uniref:Carbohydrate sulfotransferase n=1 Tax=Hyalella azteca TaxID=294128 RepID=A0A8B7PNR9_HYAAZ|nr:carbohydrate sulfotransferase 11-like [Hyalella azteca]
MAGITGKIVVIALLGTTALVILTSSPMSHPANEFQLNVGNIEELIKVLEVAGAESVQTSTNPAIINENQKEYTRSKNKKNKVAKRGKKPKDNHVIGSDDDISLIKKLQRDSNRAKRKKGRKGKKIVDKRYKTNAGSDIDFDNLMDAKSILDLNDPERLRRHKVTPLKDLPRDQWWPVILKPSYGKVFATLNLSNYSETDSTYLKRRLPEYAARAWRVSEVCSRHPELMEKKVNIKTMVWDVHHTPNLVWCQIPKIASSSWNADFFKLGHPDEKDALLPSEEHQDELPEFNLHHEVFRLFPAPNTTKERNEVFKNAIRFMIVRHPFVRLVSAFRDKMEQPKPKPVWFHYEKMQKLIIKRYRPVDSPENSEYPTFREFVQFVLDQTAEFKTPEDWTRKVVGGKEWRHHINGTSSNEVADDFFRQLTKKLVEELYQRYRIDFDLFGYSPEHYINLVSDE